MVTSKKIKTGIFGGSFNPIHIGHLALANYLCEYTLLDEVWFMVTPRNPLKEDRDLLEDTLRLKLVELAVRGYGRFHASDFEFHLSRPSYTIQTLDALKETYPEREFYLIIGADNWAIFHQWRDYLRILTDYKVIVYPRPGTEVDMASLPFNVQLVPAPLFDISSTFVRNAIQQGKDVSFFLHPAVGKEIYAKEYFRK